MRVSVIVTTKNEERHIENCLRSIAAQVYPNDLLEIIVVDNDSTDRTKEIAKKFTNQVYNYGPERSAQRNYGMIEKAVGEYVMYLDADMILCESVIVECVEIMDRDPKLVGLYIPEIIMGDSFWCKVRRFERSFYTGTVIDCVRFLRRETFCAIDGFDLALTGPEDWDLDKRIRMLGCTAVINTSILHDEGHFSVRAYLRKKGYYAKSMDTYITKWGKIDRELTRQLGWRYRLIGVFLTGGGWKQIIRHPVLSAGILSLRILVGIRFALRRLCR